MHKEEIIAATRHCFAAPDAAAVNALETALDASRADVMQQCLWVLDAANATLDAEARQLAEIFATQGATVACHAGCIGCCRQMVLCQPFEGAAIAAYLTKRPDLCNAVLADCRRWEDATARLRPSYLEWAQRRYGQGEDTGAHTLADFTEPCPCLDDAGRCRIYPVRPYGCRTCIAVDPACADPAGDFGGRQKQFALYTPHHAMRMEITRRLLRRLGCPPAVTPMPLMLLEHRALP